MYQCEGYKIPAHLVPVTEVVGGKRVNNIFVDHIDPIIHPETGFVDWDTVIGKMFCEEEGLQLLCKECHKEKTADERKRRKK